MNRLGHILAALACCAIPPAAAAPMKLGVQTHFSQNWPITLVDRLKEIKAPAIRDSLPWPASETRPGVYDFNRPAAAPIRAACRQSVDVLLTLEFRNPLYDGGVAATSPAARLAYANYVSAVLDAFPGCIVGIEVGNEINGGKGLEFLNGADVPTSYVALMRTLAEVVKPRHPGVALLGGSTNLIGTGFLASLFSAGLLKVADGIVVHPYRTHAETVDFEIANLRATMLRHGCEKPIWATEFSDNYDTAEIAAPEQVKMVTLISAAGVERAYWYAMIDQAWFRNMGLIDANQRLKPAGESFRLIQERLLAKGPAQRINTGDRRTFLYRYGPANGGDYVVWGSPRPIIFTGAPVLRDARGLTIRPPAMIGHAPLIVSGASGYRLGQGPIIADSLYEYGAAPWSYFARIGAGAATAMPLRNNQFESLFALPNRTPLRLGSTGGSPGGDARAPERAVLRYTSPSAQQVKVAACFSKPVIGDGVDVTIRQGARILYSGLLTERLNVTDVFATLPAGGTLDFEMGPNKAAGNDSFNAHIQLVMPDAPIVPTCP